LSSTSLYESITVTLFSFTPLGRHGTVAVEYAVAVGTLAAAIALAFSGLGGRLVEKLAALPI
jgi:hypothetical protein